MVQETAVVKSKLSPLPPPPLPPPPAPALFEDLPPLPGPSSVLGPIEPTEILPPPLPPPQMGPEAPPPPMPIPRGPFHAEALDTLEAIRTFGPGQLVVGGFAKIAPEEHAELQRQLAERTRGLPRIPEAVDLPLLGRTPIPLYGGAPIHEPIGEIGGLALMGPLAYGAGVAGKALQRDESLTEAAGRGVTAGLGAFMAGRVLGLGYRALAHPGRKAAAKFAEKYPATIQPTEPVSIVKGRGEKMVFAGTKRVPVGEPIPAIPLPPGLRPATVGEVVGEPVKRAARWVGKHLRAIGRPALERNLRKAAADVLKFKAGSVERFRAAAQKFQEAGGYVEPALRRYAATIPKPLPPAAQLGMGEAGAMQLPSREVFMERFGKLAGMTQKVAGDLYAAAEAHGGDVLKAVAAMLLEKEISKPVAQAITDALVAAAPEAAEVPAPPAVKKEAWGPGLFGQETSTWGKTPDLGLGEITPAEQPFWTEEAEARGVTAGDMETAERITRFKSVSVAYGVKEWRAGRDLPKTAPEGWYPDQWRQVKVGFREAEKRATPLDREMREVNAAKSLTLKNQMGLPGAEPVPDLVAAEPPQISADLARAEIERIGKIGEDRLAAAKDEAIRRMHPAAIDWLTEEEATRFHELQLALPKRSQAEAQAAVKAKRAARLATAKMEAPEPPTAPVAPPEAPEAAPGPPTAPTPPAASVVDTGKGDVAAKRALPVPEVPEGAKVGLPAAPGEVRQTIEMLRIARTDAQTALENLVGEKGDAAAQARVEIESAIADYDVKLDRLHRAVQKGGSVPESEALKAMRLDADKTTSAIEAKTGALKEKAAGVAEFVRSEEGPFGSLWYYRLEAPGHPKHGEEVEAEFVPKDFERVGEPEEVKGEAEAPVAEAGPALTTESQRVAGYLDRLSVGQLGQAAKWMSAKGEPAIATVPKVEKALTVARRAAKDRRAVEKRALALGLEKYEAQMEGGEGVAKTPILHWLPYKIPVAKGTEHSAEIMEALEGRPEARKYFAVGKYHGGGIDELADMAAEAGDSGFKGRSVSDFLDAVIAEADAAAVVRPDRSDYSDRLRTATKGIPEAEGRRLIKVAELWEVAIREEETARKAAVAAMRPFVTTEVVEGTDLAEKLRAMAEQAKAVESKALKAMRLQADQAAKATEAKFQAMKKKSAEKVGEVRATERARGAAAVEKTREAGRAALAAKKIKYGEHLTDSEREAMEARIRRRAKDRKLSDAEVAERVVEMEIQGAKHARDKSRIVVARLKAREISREEAGKTFAGIVKALPIRVRGKVFPHAGPMTERELERAVRQAIRYLDEHERRLYADRVQKTAARIYKHRLEMEEGSYDKIRVTVERARGGQGLTKWQREDLARAELEMKAAWYEHETAEKLLSGEEIMERYIVADDILKAASARTKPMAPGIGAGGEPLAPDISTARWMLREGISHTDTLIENLMGKVHWDPEKAGPMYEWFVARMAQASRKYYGRVNEAHEMVAEAAKRATGLDVHSLAFGEWRREPLTFNLPTLGKQTAPRHFWMDLANTLRDPDSVAELLESRTDPQKSRWAGFNWESDRSAERMRPMWADIKAFQDEWLAREAKADEVAEAMWRYFQRPEYFDPISMTKMRARGVRVVKQPDYWGRTRNIRYQKPQMMPEPIRGVEDFIMRASGRYLERTGSASSLLIGDAFKRFYGAVYEDAAFVGYAVPVRDAYKILGAMVETDAGEITLRGALERLYGRKFGANLNDHLLHIMRTRRLDVSRGHEGLPTTTARSILNAGRRSVLSWNPGPWISQLPSGILAAADTVHPIAWGRLADGIRRAFGREFGSMSDLLMEVRPELAYRWREMMAESLVGTVAQRPGGTRSHLWRRVRNVVDLGLRPLILLDKRAITGNGFAILDELLEKAGVADRSRPLDALAGLEAEKQDEVKEALGELVMWHVNRQHPSIDPAFDSGIAREAQQNFWARLLTLFSRQRNQNVNNFLRLVSGYRRGAIGLGALATGLMALALMTAFFVGKRETMSAVYRGGRARRYPKTAGGYGMDMVENAAGNLYGVGEIVHALRSQSSYGVGMRGSPPVAALENEIKGLVDLNLAITGGTKKRGAAARRGVESLVRGTATLLGIPVHFPLNMVRGAGRALAGGAEIDVDALVWKASGTGAGATEAIGKLAAAGMTLAAARTALRRVMREKRTPPEERSRRLQAVTTGWRTRSRAA